MKYYAVTEDPNELMHYGILGMKWGIRHDNPRHTGSGRRSHAYKKAQSKLGKMMKSGIKKAEASWKAYNSPAAKEARFMDKAMEKARTGTLKYGKLTDDQVRRVTERLNLEKQARILGGEENPRLMKRIGKSIGNGVVEGLGRGTSAYFEERFRGRGRTTAEFKAEKRREKYNSKEGTIRRKRDREIAEEYYRTSLEEGSNPYRYSSPEARAKYLAEVRRKNEQTAYAENLQKIRDEAIARQRGNLEGARYAVDHDQRRITSSQSSGLSRLNAYNELHESRNTVRENQLAERERRQKDLIVTSRKRKRARRR